MLKNQNQRKRRKKLSSARPHIALGLSGGVDSATSAALLLSEGYQVTGVTCVFCDGDDAVSNIQAAESVCRHLGIDHVVYEAQEIFNQEVIHPFIHDCASGLTPAPCVMCNRHCKIPVLCAAADELGCDKVATGHYARVIQDRKTARFALKRALDESKDQSYMLSLLTQDQLARLVLPLGGYTKLEVRAYAEEHGIPVAHRAESQDLCFITGDYRDFLRDAGIEDERGKIVTFEGEIVGEHKGLHHYTLGQRKGLGVAMGEPYFVVAKDPHNNTIVIAPKNRTFISSLEVKDLNWMFEIPQGPCMVKIRYRSKPALADVVVLDGGRARINFYDPQSLTAPGQCCAIYQGSDLLGGAIIDRVFFLE
jgi:tRNA-specific 2-thiouridylase